MNEPTKPIRVPATIENIRSIVDWQLAGFVHPLTCGKDSQHPDLLPTVDEKNLALVCVECGYKQLYIPETCITGPRDIGWARMRDALSGKLSVGDLNTFKADFVKPVESHLRDLGVVPPPANPT